MERNEVERNPIRSEAEYWSHHSNQEQQ